jgi:hypothetical protein
VEEQSQTAAVRQRSGLLLLIAASGLLLVPAAVPRNALRAASLRTAVRADVVAYGPDFNGDGFADLAVGVPGDLGAADHSGSVHVIYGSSTGLNGETPVDDQVWNHASFETSVVIPQFQDGFGKSLAAGDFNGDGFDELAIGAPFTDAERPRRPNAGAVYILAGSSSGLSQVGLYVLTQESTRIRNNRSQTNEGFGWTLAAANFGRGPEDDLAISVVNQNVFGKDDAGSVNVLYGSPTGVLRDRSSGQQWSQLSFIGIPGDPEHHDRFGTSLAAADLGRTKEADLVVGVPGEDIGSLVNAGAVNVIYGSQGGLTAIRSQFWHQNSRRIPGVAKAGDRFGAALAVANFGRAGQADLAVGAPSKDVGSRTDAGAVTVLYGSVSGVTTAGAQIWHQGTAGIPGRPETNDRFGASLIGADFALGPPSDLAVGVPGEGIEEAGARHAGLVNVINGSPVYGLRPTGATYESQNSSGFDGAVEGDSETNDEFGRSLTAGNFGNGPGFDLAVGVPGESEEHGIFGNSEIGVGAVNVLYGDIRGLRATDDQFWWQSSDSLHDSTDAFDHFGAALAR